MSIHKYEYWGMMAKLWDLFRGNTSIWPDRRFYLEAIERYGQPVLDVGCGTGRLLVDYRTLGIDIDGVDNSPEMLVLCVEKAQTAGVTVNLEEQSMQELDLPRRYRTILVPSSSFQLLTDMRDARKALQRFHAHLLPDGRLIMSIMQMLRAGDPLDSGWQLYGERVRDEDGALLKRFGRTVYNPETELESTEDRYETWVDGVKVEEEYHVWSPATRNYSQEQVRELLAESGFSEIDFYNEFTWEPAAADIYIVVVVAKP